MMWDDINQIRSMIPHQMVLVFRVNLHFLIVVPIPFDQERQCPDKAWLVIDQDSFSIILCIW
jgi:hypothetical protein